MKIINVLYFYMIFFIEVVFVFVIQLAFQIIFLLRKHQIDDFDV
jgi:hypothetical protein